MILMEMKQVKIEHLFPQIMDFVGNLGDDVVKKVAEKIAKQADAFAPQSHGVKISAPVNPIYARRGPDKGTRRGGGGEYRGKAYPNSLTSGPIKGRFFVAKSKRYAYSWLACSPSWYSHFLEFGTSPHIYRPKFSKRMRFPVASGVKPYTFAKIIRHPGISGTRFMNRAADMAPNFVTAAIREVGLG